MKRIVAIILTAGIITACGKGKGPAPVIPEVKPVAALLSLPANNEVCTTGTVVSATESTIAFSWKSSENADSYELSVKNLETGAMLTSSTTTTTANVNLMRNTPYSWFITAKTSKNTNTAKSDVWKFYNSGPGSTSYAPFPAEITLPTMGQSVTPVAGKVTLDWNGADADNDIAGYDIYFGTTATPPVYKSNEKESILSDVPVTSNTNYFWEVVTRDLKGNTSDSGVYQFIAK